MADIYLSIVGKCVHLLCCDRKNLMEVELVRSKNDMMCLNNQLLEAIQRKLELSQELEAWQVGPLLKLLYNALQVHCGPV